jgi:predicted transcriptional regulator
LGLSRLEKYIVIIRVLEDWASITQNQIMRKGDLDLDSPKKDLDFLVNLGLICESSPGKTKTYSITNKGQKVSEYFRSKDDKSIFNTTKITRID